MKFKLVDEYVYWWPVNVVLPDTTKSGKRVTQAFEMQFEALADDEARKLQEEYNALTDPKERQEHEHGQLLRTCKDWRGVMEDDGRTEVPFSEENLRRAIRFPFFRTACYRAYADSLSENPRQGN